MSAVKDGAKLRPLEAVTVANHTSNTLLHMVSPTRPIFGHTAKADHEIVGIWDPLVHPDSGADSEDQPKSSTLVPSGPTTIYSNVQYYWMQIAKAIYFRETFS